MKNHYAKTLLVGLALHFSSIASAGEPLWSQEGFNEPESVLADTAKQVLYVSNINGNPTEKNQQGYISLLADNGKVINKEWVTGLNAPKGMALHGNLLYVADLETLHVIDVKQSKLAYSIEIHGSSMLNDIAVDSQGNVYISDLIAGGIYRIKDNQVEQWVSTERLPHPNGLYFDQDKLIVASWGEGMQADFSTKVLGSLYELDLDSAKLTLLKNTKEIGNLDGIAKIGDSLFVSDWLNGNVFQYQNQKLTLLMNAGKHAADITASGDKLLVPMMFSKRIDAYKP